MMLAVLSSSLKALALMAGFVAPVDLGSAVGSAPNFLNAGAGWIAGGRVYAAEKRVSIGWRYHPNGLYSSWDCGGTQYIAVSSTPLLIDFLSDRRAFYVGRKKDGSIVYEVWSIERPALKLASDGSVEDLVYKALKSRTVLHGLPANELGAPHGCINNRGLANGVLIKFVNSPAVFGLTWDESGAASLAEAAGPKDSPLLQAYLRVGTSAKHKTIGIVYSLLPWHDSRVRGTRAVLLIDADCDGSIDRVARDGDRELLAQGYRNDTLWLEKLGLPVVHEVPLSRRK